MSIGSDVNTRSPRWAADAITVASMAVAPRTWANASPAAFAIDYEHADAPTRLAELEPPEPAAEEAPGARQAVRLSSMSP